MRAALGAAAGRGFDLAREPPLRAHLFALGEREHVLLLLLHHIAGDGWSLASAVARCCALLWGAAAARRGGCSAGVAGAICRLHAVAAAVLGAEERCGERDSAPACVLARSGLADLPDQIDLPSDRPRPAVSSYRGGQGWAARCGGAASGLAGVGARRAGRACSWCCRLGLRRC